MENDRVEDLQEAVWELAHALEQVLVTLRDSKKMLPQDYQRATRAVDRARELTDRQ